MLPLIAEHDQVFTFRFWLDDRIHEGLHYRGELFCHVQTFPIHQRVSVYHLACKLEYQGSPTLVLLSPEQCSLWLSLRGSMVEKIILRHLPLELLPPPPALPVALPAALEAIPTTPSSLHLTTEGVGRAAQSVPQHTSQSEGASALSSP